MKLTIVGDGSFGSFLKELLAPRFELCDDAPSVILAVPISAYAEVGQRYHDKHLINVCSVQKPSMDILLKITDKATGIHPLFGRRTPADKRNSIVTYRCNIDNDTWTHSCPEEVKFLMQFQMVSKCLHLYGNSAFTPELHDVLMAKTHLAAVMAAKQMQIYVARAKDIPDELVPNSFRLLRNFVQTLDDMPAGTIESILANPYG